MRSLRPIGIARALMVLVLLGWALSTSGGPPSLGQDQPVLQVSPTSLSFEGQAGGPAPDPRYLTIANTGGGVMEWHATADADWITLGATDGKLSGEHPPIQLLVWVETEDLEAGGYQGTITISSPNAQGSPVHVSVTLTLSASPRLEVTPTSLSFEAEEGGVNPEPQTITIKNSGGGILTWEAATDDDWLTLGARSGSLLGGQSTEVLVLVDTSNLSAGDYEAKITISSPQAQNSPITVRVSLHLKAPAPYTVCSSGCSFTKIQNAIDAAEPGDTITIGPGNYNESLSVTKSLTLDGVGKATISGDGNSPAVYISNAKDITIKGFTITTGRHAMVLQNASKATITDNIIHDNIGFGVLILDSSEVEIVRNEIRRQTGPICTASVKELDQCRSGVTISIFAGGIQVQDSDNITISNNTILNSQGGVELYNSRGTIRNNIIQDNPNWAVAIINGSNATIHDNDIERNVSTGIGVFNAQATISSNDVKENTQVGILILFSSEAEVTGNNLVDTKPMEGKVGDGIEVMDGSKAIITNNTITGNARFGIMFPAWGYGIDRSHNRSSSGEIRGNTINDNNNHGIALWSSIDTVISGNTIKNNKGCGIYAERSTNITSCSGNTVSDNREGNYCKAAQGICH